MMTATLPAFDLSRPRLRQVAHWIRDELDPLVAREGPELLRADDVLTLHDIFQALKTSPGITALDLRATGIHRAVIEISGIATRWPGRLADDCDKLIDLWATKFGRLEELHPFLYGRGGRLEGIASIEETSKPALLKRWQNTCPDRLSPKRAHRRGNLGFHPGSWWINPLFACHAGIIDVDTVDGGICHDKFGAYAILLIEGRELDATTESTLTFRCANDDRGKFRLTAATPRSREPLRLLRSHSVNSMWGPKAGVRYEGLYRVTGWAVHQPKTISSSAGQQVRLGDMYYDVHLERCDPVPMDEVAKSPTADELDDYSEYKRLRKLQRDLRNKTIAASSNTNKTLPMPAKIAPTIPPLVPAPTGAKSLFKVSPAASRATAFTATPHKESPKVSKDDLGGAPSTANEEDAFIASRNPTNLSIPTAIPPLTRTDTSRSVPPRGHSSPGSKGAGSIASTSKSHQSVREVTPWIDYDLPHLALPTAIDLLPATRSTTRSDVALDQPNSPTPMGRKETRKKSADRYTVLLHPSLSGQGPNPERNLDRKKGRESIFVRSRNPIAKLFDGTEDELSTTIDYFSFQRPRAAFVSPHHASTASMHRVRASSTGDISQPAAPISLKYLSPSLLPFKGRNAVAFPYGYVLLPITSSLDQDAELPGQSLEEPFAEDVPVEPIDSLLMSLKDFIAEPTSDTASNMPTSSPVATQAGIIHRGNSHDITMRRAQAASQLTKIVKELEELEVKVAFRDQFGSPDYSHGRTRIESPSVSPKTLT